MNCPKCNGPSEVSQTFQTPVGTRRRRKCVDQKNCKHRFSTLEVVLRNKTCAEPVRLVRLSELDALIKAVDNMRDATALDAPVVPPLSLVDEPSNDPEG